MSADIQYKDAVRVTLDQMDLIHRIIEQYHSTFKFVDSAQGKSNRRGKGRTGGRAARRERAARIFLWQNLLSIKCVFLMCKLPTMNRKILK